MVFHVLAAVLLSLVGQAPPVEPPEPPAARTGQADIAANRPARVETEKAKETGAELDREMADWLVDLARHQGHLVGRAEPRTASLHVMALLRGAIAVSPDCAGAYYWLYDLEHRLGREEPARRALAEYVRLTPGDDAARIRLFELALARLQTSEERARYAKEQLERRPLSKPFESELHRWLARHYYERRENAFAVREVEEALRLNPVNVRARELAYEMFSETEPALQRVEMALQLIGINPSQANLVWDLAEFLDRLSLHARAQEWYNRAIELHRRAEAGLVPAEFWHKLAVSYASAGNFERARQSADKALQADPDLHTARLLRANALGKLGLEKEAAADLAFVARAYETRVDKAVAEKRYDEVARIAWFHCCHRPDPKQALRLAEVAMKDPEPSSLARIAYGYALRMNGRTEAAIRVLKPLAARDQLAACELARAQIERGEKALALTTLHKAATLQHSGIAYDLIVELLRNHGEAPPKAPPNTAVIAALDAFNRDVFDYHTRPRDFLRFAARFEDDPLPPVGPIRVTFRAENIGPFPITFGEGFMARPLVAVSVRVGGESGTHYENALQVMMNSRPTLLPGDAIEKTLAINVGPMREDLIRSITEPVPVEITALFDPVYRGDRLAAGLGTIRIGPIRAVRSALDLSPEGLATIFERAKSTDVRERARAADHLGAILATARAGLPEPIAKAVPVEAARAGLAELLSDDAWPVRAHALVAAGWSGLDKRITVAAAPRVRDEKPVVKLLAVRLFAERQGEAFQKVLEHLSRSDPTDFVRMMAASYLPGGAQARAEAPAIEP